MRRKPSKRIVPNATGPTAKAKPKWARKLGVKDYTDAKVQAEMKDPEMAKAIKEGVKEKDTDKTKMKAFSDLSDDEIKASGGVRSRVQEVTISVALYARGADGLPFFCRRRAKNS